MPRRLGSDTYAQEAIVASAATVDLSAVKSRQVAITGTTSISSFGSAPNGEWVVRFLGALTLVHNATSLIVPGAANLATAAGDTCIIDTDASGNVRILAYQRAARSPDAAFNLAATAVQTPGAWTAYTPTASATSGAFTTVGSTSGRYCKIGRMVTVNVDVSITTVGNAGGAMAISLPFAAAAIACGCGRETNTTGAQLQAYTSPGVATLYVYNYGNGFPMNSGSRAVLTITYETTS